MSDEKPVRQTVLQGYNDAIKQITGTTDLKSIEPLTFRLKCEWDVATKIEQMICKGKVDEACQVICKVTAPNASEQLLHAYKHLQDRTAKIVDILEESGANTKWCDNARKGLKSGKRCLRTKYRVHCNDAANPCPDHCRQYALSDQYAEFQVNCDHEHTLFCESCEALKSVKSSSMQAQLPEMSFYSEEQKDDILYDIRQATDMILQWKAHILRSENQDIAKTKLIKSLPSDAILILMDWAMKFTQLKYREKQSEWFGKRGMSRHVSCVISRSVTAQCHHISSYVNLIDNCEQDWYAVRAILTNLLETIKGTQPYITKVYLRSDGAGCYHNNLIAAVSNLGSQVGIQVIRSVKPIFVLCVT